MTTRPNVLLKPLMHPVAYAMVDLISTGINLIHQSLNEYTVVLKLLLMCSGNGFLRAKRSSGWRTASRANWRRGPTLDCVLHLIELLTTRVSVINQDLDQISLLFEDWHCLMAVAPGSVQRCLGWWRVLSLPELLSIDQHIQHKY